MGSVPKTTKHLLVDLDGTLYRSAKLFDDVRKNINGEKISADLASEYTNARGLCRAFREKRKSLTPLFRILFLLLLLLPRSLHN